MRNTLESSRERGLGGEIDLHPVELFTFRNSEFRHKHDFYMPPTRQIKQTKTASTHD